MKKRKFFKNNDGGVSGVKITTAVMLSLMIAFVSYFSYSFYKTDDALSKVPRADLMPIEEPTPTKTTPTPTGTPTSKTTTKTKEPHKIDYSKIPSKNGLVDGKKLKSATNDGDVDENKMYSTNPNNVNGVSTELTDAKIGNLPKGVETYLFMGSDSRNIKKDRGRSDSIMLAYVNRAHNKVYLVSFPRDLYVKIPGYAKQKVNAAYNKGGSPLTVRTIQNFTGIKINHAAVVNFNSFVNLVDSVGGVKVYNPYTGCDNHQKLCWKKGTLNLKSWDALHYVRWRHGLPNGDITRSQNQQAVVKAILAKAASPSMLANPNKLSDFIKKAGENVVVDKSLTNSKIMSEVLGMRITSSNDIRTITAPISGYYMDPIYGSVDLVNASRMAELRKALATDNLESYWNKYKNAPVAGAATMYQTNNL